MNKINNDLSNFNNLIIKECEKCSSEKIKFDYLLSHFSLKEVIKKIQYDDKYNFILDKKIPDEVIIGWVIQEFNKRKFNDKSRK